jgi:hypothetical protein
MQALRNAGEPLEETLDGKRKIWRLHPAARRETITLSTKQMVSLFFSRRVLDFLSGFALNENIPTSANQKRSTWLIPGSIRSWADGQDAVRPRHAAQATLPDLWKVVLSVTESGRSTACVLGLGLSAGAAC